MSTDMKTVKANCLCGKAKHEIAVPRSDFPLQAEWCHCSSCRHMVGTLSLNIARLPERYEPPKELFNELTAFEFSPRLTQYFCSTCGSQMISFIAHAPDNSRDAHWDIMTGTLERAEGIFELKGYDFIGDTIDGGFSDFLPKVNGKQLERWPGRPNEGEQLPLYWQSPDRPTITPKADDKLHAHCKCGGVNFWLSRPSERSKKAADHSEWWLRDDGRKFLAGNCSCNSCRLDTGMEIMSWCFIPTVDISLNAEGTEGFKVPFGTLKAYNSSKGITRYHCGVCGASVFFTSEERTDLVDVAVGLLDAPEGVRAESWLDWRMDRLSYREDAMPRAETLTLSLEEGQQAWAERQRG